MAGLALFLGEEEGQWRRRGEAGAEPEGERRAEAAGFFFFAPPAAAAAVAAAAAAPAETPELFLRLLGCGVEGGARLAVETLGVTRAEGESECCLLALALLGVAAAAVFITVFAVVFVRAEDVVVANAPLLGRTLASIGFLNSDLAGPTELARAVPGRERAVWSCCLEGGSVRDEEEEHSPNLCCFVSIRLPRLCAFANSL